MATTRKSKKAAVPAKKTAAAAPAVKMATGRKAVAGAALHSRVPVGWEADTSLTHWIPDERVRDELAALGKEAARTPADKRGALWKKMTRLLPPALSALIGKSPWRWSSTVSPEVARTVVDLMRYAIIAPEHELPELISSIQRIMPDLPAAASMPEVLPAGEFDRVLDEITRAKNDLSDVARCNALEELYSWATDS